MSPLEQWLAFCTLLRKEVSRFCRIWPQTLLPPVISMSLYFLIFGELIGSRIGLISGIPYLEYIAPGLIMMSVINSAYGNVASSFFGAKFQSHIEEMLVSSMPIWVLLAGYLCGGVVRAVMTSMIVTGVALLFTDLPIYHPGAILLVVLSSALMFSAAGMINGIFASKFDDISIIPTFVLTPLTYLGGVFFSIDMLPDPWHTIALANPILYIINFMRYGMLGVSDFAPGWALLVIGVFLVAFLGLALWLMQRGIGLRT